MKSILQVSLVLSTIGFVALLPTRGNSAPAQTLAQSLEEHSITIVPETAQVRIRNYSASQSLSVQSPQQIAQQPIQQAQQPVKQSELPTTKEFTHNISTSSAALQAETLTSPTPESFMAAQVAEASQANVVAQQTVDPGRATRSGSSYFGIAGNIGLTGNSSDLGRTSFTVISKIGLLDILSVRPSVAINQNATILIPVTVDFPLQTTSGSRLSFAPYLGGGLVVTTGSGGRVGGLVTAGLDFPVTPEFTATAAVNIGFLNNTDVGLLLGIGYNFVGF